ncbi:MAG: DUF5681 domain-containing protein [Candidatus Nanopelagicaceae bacterium]
MARQEKQAHGGSLTRPEKGETMNPNGRPKGRRNRSTVIRKWLEAIDKGKNPITGETESMSVEDRMTLGVLAKALKGDTQAYRALMDSAYGQPKQDMEIQHSGGINIQPVEWVKSEDQ